jgi:hypothetical protein
MSEPTVDWHSTQNRVCRSAHESAEWLRSQKKGGLFDHLNNTMAQLQSKDALERMGIPTRCAGAMRDVSPDHPAVAAMNEQAGRALRFGCTLNGCRMRRNLYVIRGWPALFTLCSNESAAVRNQVSF